MAILCSTRKRKDGIVYAVTAGGDKVVVTDGKFPDQADVVIPNNIDGMPVVAVEKNAFANSQGIKSIVLPASVQDIQPYAFHHSYDLEEVTFMADTVTLGASVFEGCEKLRIIRGNQLQTKSSRAFWRCQNLESITADFVGEVFHQTFGKCSKLEDLSFADKVLLHHNPFYGTKRLRTLFFETNAALSDEAKRFVVKNTIVCNKDSWLSDLAYEGAKIILRKKN